MFVGRYKERAGLCMYMRVDKSIFIYMLMCVNVCVYICIEVSTRTSVLILRVYIYNMYT